MSNTYVGLDSGVGGRKWLWGGLDSGYVGLRGWKHVAGGLKHMAGVKTRSWVSKHVAGGRRVCVIGKIN